MLYRVLKLSFTRRSMIILLTLTVILSTMLYFYITYVKLYKRDSISITRKYIDSPLESRYAAPSMTTNLTEQVRILIWVLTGPQYLDSRAIHVKKTWGRRCNILLFFSSVDNKTFPTIGTNASEGRNHLTAKSVFAWNYIFKHYFNEADWFMKADDNTYVILENLRHFLSSEDTNQPIFFGQHFQAINKNGFFSGGSGYVLSKAALKRYSTTPSITIKCRKDGQAEDAAMGHCMEKLGVKVGSSVDSQGRSRFHCFHPSTHIDGSYPKWYYKYDSNGAKKGIGNISDYPVSFHYINPQMMYQLDYYIYHLKLYYNQDD